MSDAIQLSDVERASVLRHREVWAEENAALIKFGRQYDVPDGTGYAWQKQEAELTRMACQSAFATGDGTWHAILHEEVAEAFAESDPARLRAELIQVAAVALRWIDAIDSRDQT